MRSIGTRIAFSAVSITMTIVLGLGVVSYFFMKRSTEALLKEKLHSESTIIGNRLESILADLEHTVESLANNQIIISALTDSAGRESYLDPFMKGLSLTDHIPFTLTLCDFEGKTISSNQHNGPDYTDHPEMIPLVIDQEQPYSALSLMEGERGILIASPVFYGATGMAEGVLVLEIKLNEVVGAVIAKTPLGAEQALFMKALGEDIWQKGGLARDHYLLIERNLTREGPLADLHLVIEYGESREKNVASLRKLQLLYLISGLAVFLLTILVSRSLTRKLILPLTILADTADQVAGSGKPVAGIKIKGDGEVARLVASINTMLLRLSQAHETLEQRVAERTGELLETTRKLQQEVAERKNAEDEARQGKEKWEQTFNAIPDIITIQDPTMRIVAANKAARDFLATEPGELLGKYCYQLFRGASSPCADCPELVTIQKGKPHGAIIAHENLGKIFFVSSSPILDAAGQATHIVHIAKDITQQKKLEEELFQAHKMEAIGTLAGGIAHDFNNILTAILGYASLIKKEISTSEHSTQYSDYLEQVITGSNRAKELVRQILSFSRKDANILQPIQPGPVIREALKLLRASLPATIEMQTVIEPDCGLILASPTTLHQVVVNLCTNALYAMEERHGVLTVGLRRVEALPPELDQESSRLTGPLVELSVADTGRGMDATTRKRIFEPYFTTKKFGHGSGMGLAVVHGIVYGCGGVIRVASEPDKGTTFRLYFPVLTGQALPEPAAESTIPLGGQERILLVDDEAFIAGLFRDTLKPMGYQVTAETSSKKALSLFQADPEAYDLLVTDQTMPELTGVELTREILKIKPGFPIILCTGYSSQVTEQNAAELGITRFLMKPVSGFELARTIREIFA